VISGAWRETIFLLTFCVPLPAASSGQQPVRFVITGPTLISFFLNYTDEETKTEGNEALNDFLFYLPAAEDKLKEAGVHVNTVFKVDRFQVKAGSKWRTIKPPRGRDVGYFFIAPGREPHIELGVEDTESILIAAGDYFRLNALPRRLAYPLPDDHKFAQPLREFLITPHGAGKVSLAMSKEEILRLFPAPLAMETGGSSPEIHIFTSNKPQPDVQEVALRLFVDPQTSRIAKMDVLDKRFRTVNNLGPGSTFGDVLRGALNLSLTEESGKWVVDSAASCMTFQLDVDNATAARLATWERGEWQRVVPVLTPVRAVSLFATGCPLGR
jgi:hypothetical protein